MLSFRDSLSNPLPEPGQLPAPVFRPGREAIAVDPSKLPPGSVVYDNIPPGHVSVRATVEQLLDAFIEKIKFPR